MSIQIVDTGFKHKDSPIVNVELYADGTTNLHTIIRDALTAIPRCETLRRSDFATESLDGTLRVYNSGKKLYFYNR